MEDTDTMADINFIASRINDSRESDKDLLAKSVVEQFSIERQEAIEVLKKLDKQGRGKYIIGRGSKETRLEWFMKSPLKRRQEQINVSSSPELESKIDNNFIPYTFPLSSGERVEFKLPANLSINDAERLSAFIKTLGI